MCVAWVAWVSVGECVHSLGWDLASAEADTNSRQLRALLTRPAKHQASKGSGHLSASSPSIPPLPQPSPTLAGDR